MVADMVAAPNKDVAANPRTRLNDREFQNETVISDFDTPEIGCTRTDITYQSISLPLGFGILLRSQLVQILVSGTATKKSKLSGGYLSSIVSKGSMGRPNFSFAFWNSPSTVSRRPHARYRWLGRSMLHPRFSGSNMTTLLISATFLRSA
jgi:hypothetical protein